jgi:hypothetical protein
MRRRDGGCIPQGRKKEDAHQAVRVFFFGKGERITMSLTYLAMLSYTAAAQKSTGLSEDSQIVHKLRANTPLTLEKHRAII